MALSPPQSWAPAQCRPFPEQTPSLRAASAVQIPAIARAPGTMAALPRMEGRRRCPLCSPSSSQHPIALTPRSPSWRFDWMGRPGVGKVFLPQLSSVSTRDAQWASALSPAFQKKSPELLTRPVELNAIVPLRPWFPGGLGKGPRQVCLGRETPRENLVFRVYELGAGNSGALV